MQANVLERELTKANEKMQDIINAIPGGVAIYKVSDIFETVYFSDGVPELSGYTVEEYHELIKKDAAEMTYWEDTEMVVSKAREVIRTHEVSQIEFRKQHRDGHIVWVRVQIKWIGEEDGCPLLHCVFHNISDLKEAKLELDHLVNSIPGGIASYQIEESRISLTYFSDGVASLTGHTREEYEQIVRQDMPGIVYSCDKERVKAALKTALESGETMDISFRVWHKEGRLIWIHLNARRMGPRAGNMKFYAVYTGMSGESHLMQAISNETAEGIYVIDKSNYDLLYANEASGLFLEGRDCVGQKCYAALHGKDAPCEFCTLQNHAPDGKEHVMKIEETGRYYSTRFRETNWNGLEAYVRSVREITDEVLSRMEKERLEKYFQTVLQHLPGGVAVVCYDKKDGVMKPEFLSEGFAAMTGMPLEEAWDLYRNDAMSGVHPEDQRYVNEQMELYIASGESHCEIVYRIKKGADEYVWVKNVLSLIESKGGERRIYSVYQDMTKQLEEQSRLRQQYQDLIMQHYRVQEPNTLVLGHCNITQNLILEIIDHTDSDLLETFGVVREEFFTGISSLIVEEEERSAFLKMYLNKPALEAFERKETEQKLSCFVKLPKEERGRYVQIVVNLVATPDSGDVTGILTITDITEKTIRERILHRLSAAGYDFIVDVDLTEDTYTVLMSNDEDGLSPKNKGSHSQWIAYMMEKRVVPSDRQRYIEGLAPEHMLERLEKRGTYTFAFSVYDDCGNIRTKNITVSAADLRLGRVCLSRADITDSVREQQGLLHVIAYTFELAGFVNIENHNLTLYSRKTVLANLPPYFVEDYTEAIQRFVGKYGADTNLSNAREEFQIDTMIRCLREKPQGYDFLFSYKNGEERYKQINVMWGDVNHKTICLVRADVTDMLAAERQTKKTLENALALAEEASRAKSEFMSAMSHDIRTPMNAIMGMTTLAQANLGDREKVEGYLRTIELSSRHLLSLINDILDMSKIERSQISLNRMRISIRKLIEQISAIMEPQAREAGLEFTVDCGEIEHTWFYGDGLRINQILINILSNAVKYTPEGGSVEFKVEEIPSLKDSAGIRYRFIVSDTGVGMSEEFLAHVFEPFMRSKSSSLVEGTGLGLSITKGLVELMGGQISVESTVHQGTRFQVELEVEGLKQWEENPRETDTGRSLDVADKAIFEGRLFLVAEDNAINAEILCELLAMYGAKAVVKRDGFQAVQEFASKPAGIYDAVMMDIQMPVMNGYEAARAIRKMERPDAAGIPIIAMTANVFAEDVREAAAAGMNGHIAKPIDIEVMKQTLWKVLNCS
ncbi:PAS domain-containing protein [Bariatricus massiliensis]|uniref:Stage 0 sporulation protein A homolog n=1 Tax=Bariatricus massiliensis TaxID=1745713 RepID=A0ABS8DIW8_9FIRM|nr:PAS domain-containing hybrid sensor histidine kinase/response regulator [Bariatricus massiliensis]MCB7305238.1 PAS domain-containing protein [Bariatricus massiliensis]MCB7375869.1 PAS domain-containing protein [Bariatricus massiliensis]MCB7388381.1 PAS domain-containing protein [Bariatricus massiliensis]MCB7412631.1 PAS domain-containing protein [Bariatricus massiliensis]MCQ5254731.1 PAS domain-containing protein [Bariatricus massiliensis]